MFSLAVSFCDFYTLVSVQSAEFPESGSPPSLLPCCHVLSVVTPHTGGVSSCQHHQSKNYFYYNNKCKSWYFWADPFFSTLYLYIFHDYFYPISSPLLFNYFIYFIIIIYFFFRICWLNASLLVWMKSVSSASQPLQEVLLISVKCSGKFSGHCTFIDPHFLWKLDQLNTAADCVYVLVWHRIVEEGLSYRFHASWPFVLQILACFYRVAGKKAHAVMTKVQSHDFVEKTCSVH